MTEAARSLSQRKSDALLHLENDKDLWFASSDLEGRSCLVPLSFWWDGEHIFVATIGTNPTGKNIENIGIARVALGHTRDVVLIDGVVSLVDQEFVKQVDDAYAVKCGWRPTESANYFYYRFEPSHIESWRELNEHADRLLMTEGKWLV